MLRSLFLVFIILLDRSILQVTEGLLHCVIIPSLRLAAKVNEEKEACTPEKSTLGCFGGIGVQHWRTQGSCASGHGGRFGKVINFPGISAIPS